MKKLMITCAISISSLFSLFMLSASAQVVINGNLVQGGELAELEYLLGAPVPDGSYWVNTNTGSWGYEGNSTVQGNLFYEVERSPSSEEGRSYVRIDSSPSGTYVSDGECAYYSTPHGGSFRSCD